MKKLFVKLESWLAFPTRRRVVLLVVSAACLLLSLIGAKPHLGFDPAWIAAVLCGLPIVLGAVSGLVLRFDIRADVLVSMALIASVCIDEVFAAAEIAVIMSLGSLLEELTTAKAYSGIERLVRMTPQAARVLRDGRQSLVRVEEISVGELLRVLPGETVPLDGVIVSGQTSLDCSALTGESMPVDKAVGDEVSSGQINLYGTFDLRVVRRQQDSALQRMTRLVQSADAGRAKIVRLADRWATWIVVAALTAAVITWLVTGQLQRAVTILVVFCPCALVLATPTAIMAAAGNASRHGFLVRAGDALERLSAVDCITFDKTGTLTRGVAEISAVHPLGRFTREQLLELAAAAESRSEHPLGKAIARGWTGDADSVSEFRMTPGRGVTATVDGHRVAAGNARLIQQLGLTAPQGADDTGGTAVFVSADGAMAGYLVLRDCVRADALCTLEKLRGMDVRRVMLTGDNAKVADSVAEQLSLDQVRAGCLPEDKLSAIEALQAEGHTVCMIGDGINDAPSLKKADVGIAMGGIGSDIAVEAADIVLMGEQLSQLPHLLCLARRTMKTIRLNLIFAMGLNLLATALAIAGVLGPVAGALVHNAGSVAVVISSALLLRWRLRESPVTAEHGQRRLRRTSHMDA